VSAVSKKWWWGVERIAHLVSSGRKYSYKITGEVT